MDNFEQNQANNSASSPGNQSTQQTGTTSFADEFKSFYKGDFKSIMTNFFNSPTDGVRDVFGRHSDKAYTNALILFVSVFLVYAAGYYLGVGKEGRESLEMLDFVKFGIYPVLFMLVVSLLSFLIKSVTGKADFKTELLTGGLCGIPLGIFMLALLSLRLLNDDDMLLILTYPLASGMAAVLILIYILLMLVNVVQQSLRASGAKDSLSWYSSPAVILLSGYIASRLFEEVIL